MPCYGIKKTYSYPSAGQNGQSSAAGGIKKENQTTSFEK
jgi:hypothetical protein